MTYNRLLKKYGILLGIFLLMAAAVLISGCSISEKEDQKEKNSFETKKAYDLPVDTGEKEEAEEDCKNVMKLVSDIYTQADKGEASNVVLSEETINKMMDRITATGNPVISSLTYSNMKNYKTMENFLKTCADGKKGMTVMYEVHVDGGIGRKKYVFDGTDMYVLYTAVNWNQENSPVISYISYTRIREWRYTEKGWFCYELCVPEPPEVSEIVDGSCLVRVRPMTEENRELSLKCVKGIGYQGNNLLCSNWDADHMEALDYNGMYQYLYAVKYGERFDAEKYRDGIPEEEFESLIMEYLPITKEQIREYAVFDEEKGNYVWERLSCFNYELDFFWTSIPEVIDIRENEDGTVTLTVDAVCDMVLCDDAVITHELTVRFLDDGRFQYLGNQIRNNGIQRIPDYQYRIYQN